MITSSIDISYVRTQKSTSGADVPHEVVADLVDNDWSIIRAWCEYLGWNQ